jgi:hypothetical protein
MKKIKSNIKYKKTHIRRNKKELNRREEKFKGFDYYPMSKQELLNRILGSSPVKPDVTLKTPEVFSLTKNPDETVEFINQIRSAMKDGKSVLCDLSDATDLTSDAIVAVIALSNDPKVEKKPTVLGNEPKNPKLSDKFRDSGIYGSHYIQFSDGAIRKAHGTIYRKSSDEVEGKIASDLIEFATEKIFGEARKQKGVYTSLIECMNNTINHATSDKTKEVWWATVYFDAEKNTAFFNFLDNGIGILESLSLKWQNSLLRLTGLKDNADIMREVLNGKIGSRTGLAYRGNGLPEIYKRFQRKQFSRLMIIANNVFVDVERDEYRILSKPFNGTFFHWEISYDEHNQHYENDDSRGE